MAKIKWPRTGNTYSPRMRGVFLSYPHPLYGYIARAWPRKRGRQRPAVTWTNAQYAIRQLFSARPFYLDYETALNWAKGVAYTWRDIFNMQIAGGANFSTLITDDGVVWQRLLCVSDNPQALLDLIDDTVGDLLFRDTSGWNALTPGTDGYVLTMHGGVPLWLPNSPSGGLASIGPSTINSAVSAAFTAGNVGGQVIKFPTSLTINRIVFWAAAAAATAHITPVIYKLTWPTSLNLVAKGPTVTGATAGKNSLPLTGPYAAAAGDLLMIGALIRVANVTICGPGSLAVTFSAYNTNDTPPTGPIVASGVLASWGGFYAEN
jgi:hypothetical protein